MQRLVTGGHWPSTHNGKDSFFYTLTWKRLIEDNGERRGREKKEKKGRQHFVETTKHPLGGPQLSSILSPAMRNPLSLSIINGIVKACPLTVWVCGGELSFSPSDSQYQLYSLGWGTWLGPKSSWLNWLLQLTVPGFIFHIQKLMAEVCVLRRKVVDLIHSSGFFNRTWSRPGIGRGTGSQVMR